MRLDPHFGMLPERAFIRGFDKQIMPQGGKGGSSYNAPAPDPRIAEAQMKMADLAEEQFQQFETDIWPNLQAQWEAQTEIAEREQEKQFEIADKQSERADEYYRRMEETFYPLQDQMVDQAKEFNSEGYHQQMASRAIGDTEAQNEIARKNSMQQMAKFGVDPTSGAAVGTNQAMNVVGAANKAAAGNRAYMAAKELGWNLGMQASGLGAGLPGASAQSTGLALQGGGQGMATGQVPMAMGGQMGNSLSQGYGGAMQGWNQVGTLGVNKYNADVSAWSAQQAAEAQNAAGWGTAIGSLGSAAITAASDIRLKENIVPIGMLPSGVHVYEYNLKPEFAHLGPPGRQVGVMAQDLLSINPDAVSLDEDGYYRVDYSKVT